MTRRFLTSLMATLLLLGVLTVTAPTPVSASHQQYDPVMGTTPLHWNAFSWGNQITIVDQTGPWPVSAASTDWNNAHHEALVHYHWNVCSHGVNCLWVKEVTDSSKNYVGAFYADWDAAGHLKQNSSLTYVDLNNAHLTTACSIYRISWATCRKHTACQEIGHGIGLAHLYGEESCMDDTLPTSTTNHGGYDYVYPDT